MKNKSTFWPVLVLLLLSPICGELLSGSSPPGEFFSVFTLFLIAMYGCAAVVIRELIHRWGKGGISLILLGFAYGIFEEGIAVRSFFDPAWVDLGVFSTYGRWAGVNWFWALDLTLFHGIISIAVPVTLVELLFPHQAERAWLGRTGMILCTLLSAATAVFGPLVGMKANGWMLLGSVGVMALLYFTAKHLPEPGIRNVRPARPIVIGMAAAGGMLLLLIVMWVLPSAQPGTAHLPASFTLAATLLVGLLGLAAYVLLPVHPWTKAQRLAWAAGSLSIWILLSVVQQLNNASRPDDTAGMAYVGLAFIILLIGLAAGIRKQDRRNTAGESV